MKKNGGRKKLPESEKKVLVPIYLKKSVIENNGGMEKLQSKIYNFVEHESKS